MQVNYSNDIVRRSETFPTSSNLLMADTAMTPYGYLQSGYGMTVLYPASGYYMVSPQFLPTPPVIERRTTNYIYDENSAALFWLRRNKNKTERLPLANFEVVIEKIYTLADTNAQEDRLKILIKGKADIALDISLDKLTPYIKS